MRNMFFPEEITEDDLYFVCYIIERTARHLHQRNKYVVNALGYDELYRLLSCASVLHCENPLKVVDDIVTEHKLTIGDFDITDVNRDLATVIPTALDMGAVYCRLILHTMSSTENFVEGILRVYNNELCDVIDNYNCSAFYEPSYVIARAYFDGGF